MGFGNKSEAQAEQRKETDFCSGSCHAEQILQILNAYRHSGTFTDVVLQVGGHEFPCHRATLSASSLYFRTMFHSQLRESCQSLVVLHDISPATMETLLNFMYEGKVDVHEDNVEDIFKAADLLGISVLSKACVKFLETQVDHSNCLGIMNFASSFFIRPLAEKCQKLVFQDFVEVYKHEEFLRLPKEQIVELLSSEQLLVEREEVLVEAVLKWVHHDPSGRKGAARELLELVRLPLVDPVFFVNTVETDDLLQDCKECRPLLQEARRYHVFGNEVNSARTQPRRSSGRTEVIVVIGGCDKNGYSRLSFTEKLNPHTKEWILAASIPGYSKSEFAACSLQNDIYVSGGQLNSCDVWRYISQLDTWVRVASLNKGRWRHKMTALDGRIYAVGGFNGSERLPTVECYRSFDNQWKPMAPLLRPVSSAALAACAGKLYVIGGAVSDDANTNQVQCYDPVENQWSYVAPSPFTQRCICATTLENIIYVVGGLMDKIYSYSPMSNTWSEVVDLPGPVESCGLTVCDSKIYILGGRNEYGFGTDRVWSYSPKTGDLTEEPPMSRCVSYHGCVTVTQHVARKP
ncbi:kelch-like protein 35 [Lepisosteus oculatus]|uniref:Kelch like family member 35 n=1 Tax=Lepisosteus oculatus TaxID=7918 RepID=W5MBS2_LEPOC|nr:PREDICTED: kelch-like protein 35 [Lepisosteus oculatus]